MTGTPFHWTRIIAEMADESLGIPPDVTFQIEENGQLHEVKAHKMILGMVSPTFKTMFYSTNVGDKTAKVIKVEKTTAPAFGIMMDAIYNVKSIEASLKGKSVHEVFDVVILVERYQIVELREVVKEILANYPIADDTVLEVEYSNMFETETQQLLLNCAKFLKSKLKDLEAVIRYAAANEDRKEVFATLLARMNDITATACPNCNKEICLDGEGVRDDEFRQGLVITNNYWDACSYVDMGTGVVTKVEADRVILVCIKPAVDHQQFSGVYLPKTYCNNPAFLFSLNNLLYYGPMETKTKVFMWILETSTHN